MPTYLTSILLTLIVTITCMKELHILNIPLTSIFPQPQMSLYQQWKILSHKLVHLNTRTQGKRILDQCMEHYLLLHDPCWFPAVSSNKYKLRFVVPGNIHTSLMKGIFSTTPTQPTGNSNLALQSAPQLGNYSPFCDKSMHIFWNYTFWQVHVQGKRGMTILYM